MVMEKWQACPVCIFRQVSDPVCAACENDKLIHLETGLNPRRHRALVGRTEVQGFAYNPKMHENINDRLPRMENPPPPPPKTNKASGDFITRITKSPWGPIKK